MKKWATLLLVFYTCAAAAEVTTTQPRRNESTRARNQQNQQAVQQCMQAEQGYQDFVTSNIEQSWKSFNNSYRCLGGAPVSGVNCQEITKSHVDQLKEYRTLTEKLYEEAATAWADERSQRNDGFTNQCFKGENGKVEFEEHIRNVKVQLPDPTMCIGERNAWMGDRDRLIADYIDGKKQSSTLTSEQMQRFGKMHRSPIMPIMNDQAKWKRDLSDQQLQSHLTSAFNNVQHGVKKLHDQVKGYQDSNRHRLYAFDNQFQSYLQTLDGEAQEQMRECAKQTGFFGDCFSSASAQGRCMNRIGEFAGELVPFWPIVDGMSGYAQAVAARNAGVITEQEAVAMQSEALTAAVFGVGGVAGGTARLARAAGQKVMRAARQRARGLTASSPPVAMSGQERAGMLSRNMSSNVGNRDRLGLAQSTLGRNLSREQKRAILQAHNTGTMRPDGSFSAADLRAKAEVLRRAGFSSAERRALMERGITGVASEVSERPSPAAARALLESAGLPKQQVDQIVGGVGNRAAQLSTSQVDQAWGAMNRQANQALRSGNLNDAKRLYGQANEFLSDELNRAIESGATGTRIDALAARVFATRNIASPVGGALPKQDRLFDQALGTNYFRKVETRGFAETYNPMSQANMNRYDPRVINSTGRNPEEVYAAANRQYQELLGVASYLNRMPYERPPAPDWLEGVQLKQVTEYLRTYRRSMEVIEQQYLGK